MIEFRELLDSEVEAVAQLWRVCGLTRAWNDPYKDISRAREGPASVILVTEAEAHIAASVMAGHDGHRGALYYVAVDPSWRGRGFGKAAVKAAEAWFEARGIWKINLLVRAENEKVRGFYEKLGYEINPVLCMGRKIGV